MEILWNVLSWKKIVDIQQNIPQKECSISVGTLLNNRKKEFVKVLDTTMEHPSINFWCKSSKPTNNETRYHQYDENHGYKPWFCYKSNKV